MLESQTKAVRTQREQWLLGKASNGKETDQDVGGKSQKKKNQKSTLKLVWKQPNV
jgi:hypothetical protein